MSHTIIYVPNANPKAKLQLLCVPYAGGSVGIFYNWQSYLPNIELGLIAYPGRYHRLNETPIDDVDVMLEAIAAECKNSMINDFALFGHGIGAFMAYGLAHKLAQLNIMPKYLFVSGVGAPFYYKDKKNDLSSLPDDQFIQALIERYNAIPEKFLNNPGLMALFIPLIRADMGLEEQLIKKYGANASPQLVCDVIAFGGVEDLTGATENSLATWKSVTTGKFQTKIFPGNHFYLNEYPEQVCAEILLHIE